MDFSTLFEDPVAMWSTITVVVSIVVVVFIVMKVLKLMNTTHSED
jgi:hypothetical protein